VMDVAGSMATPVAPGVTKEQVAVGAARSGLQLFSDSWEVGLWSFSTNMNGDQDYRQLVPIGPLTAQRDQMDGALAGLSPNPAGGTGLYGTLLAAYKTVQTGWDDNHLNSVVIVTGGKNDSGIGLSQLIASLKSIQNPDEPVQVLIIGVGPDVSASDLNQITAVTGGAVFLATDPSQIGDIFLRALALPAGQ
jgi:Ca-activated chloride channel family protein